MNALVTVRSNAVGLVNPTPIQRNQAQSSVSSTARAYHLGKAYSGAVVAKINEAQRAEQPDELSRNTFLTLLLTQVQNQDPLEPVDNTEMVAQLAQFSSLEQMQHVADGLSALSGNIDQLNFISATSLLGREIIGIDSNGEPIQGVVQHVQLNGSLVMLTVNDQLVSMAGVQSIR